MEFRVQRRAINEHPSYNSHDLALVKKFSKEIKKELGDFVKAIIFFGSGSKHKLSKAGSDVDIMIIVDDAVVILSNEVITAYRVIVQNIATKISKRFHINTVRLSNYWEYVKAGDPIIVNVLREGIAIHDSGIFEPIQHLLKQGRIRPTSESILSYQSRAIVTYSNSRWHVNQAIIDLYWSVVDSAHAALMSLDIVSPAPEHIQDLLEKHIAKPGLTKKQHVTFYKKMYTLYKRIMHREVKNIPGKQYDELQKQAKQFIDDMKKIVDKNLPSSSRVENIK